MILGLLSLVTAAGPAPAQYRRAPARHYRDDPVAMVQGWYQRYLHRNVDPSGIQTWTQSLQDGNSPAMVLGTILGSDEYIQNAGGTPRAFIRALYRDILGREPSPREYDHWLRDLRLGDYRDVASHLLTRYPQGLDPAGPPPRPYRRDYDDDHYRRPDYPSRRDDDDYDYHRPYYPYRGRPSPPPRPSPRDYDDGSYRR